MSHKTVTFPVGIETRSWKRADLKPVSKRELARNPTSPTLRYRFVEMDDECEPFDPWQLREDFLAWKVEDWRAFFFEAGRWSQIHGYMTQSDFAEWQRLLKQALLLPARDWKSLRGFDPGKIVRLLVPLPIHFDWDGEVPLANVISMDSLGAIIATIQIDALQGAEFRGCARHDCKNPPFRLEARHKIYCSPECAHLVAVRENRRRLAAKKGTSRRTLKSNRSK